MMRVQNTNILDRLKWNENVLNEKNCVCVTVERIRAEKPQFPLYPINFHATRFHYSVLFKWNNYGFNLGKPQYRCDF